MTSNSNAYDQATSAATELIATVELITFGFQRRMQFDYVSLVDVLLPLTPDQHKKLVSFVMSGLDVNIYTNLVKSGFDTQLYFDAVENGAHPALPIAQFMSALQSLQAPVAQHVLSDPSAMRQAMSQLKVAEALNKLLQQFIPGTADEESEDFAHAN